MRRPTLVAVAAGVALAVVGALSLTPAIGQAPKSGGTINIMAREDLAQGFATHETSTVATSTPSLPCFSNLVFFDPSKKTEGMDTIVGELAEKWSWQDNYKNLVFFLRKDVKWHDGKPFTSKDVKHTFDMVRDSPEATPSYASVPAKTGTPTSSTSRRPTPTRWCSASSARSRRCSSCSPPATRRCTRPMCRPPRTAPAASGPARSS